MKATKKKSGKDKAMSLRAKVKKAMAPKRKQSKDLLYLLFSQPALLASVIMFVSLKIPRIGQLVRIILCLFTM